MCSAQIIAAPIMRYADFLRLPQPPVPCTIAYGSDPLQHVELWKPDGAGPFPVVMLIHGGCWQSKVAGAGIMHLLAQAVVRRGVAVWNLEYRGIDISGGGYPGTFLDVAAAADMLRDRGAQLGLDTGRIVAVGHSSGGHLALWLAGRHRIPPGSALHAERALKLVGVVNQGGLSDLAEMRTAAAGACGANTVDRLIGPATPARPDPLADTSPPELAPLGIPQIMISGDADIVAPSAFAEAYAAKVRPKGDTVSIMTIPDQGHYEFLTTGTPAGDATIDAALHLLARPA